MKAANRSETLWQATILTVTSWQLWPLEACAGWYRGLWSVSSPTAVKLWTLLLTTLFTDPIDSAKSIYQRNSLLYSKGQTVEPAPKIQFFRRHMYRGLGVSMSRSCVVNAIFFSSFEFIKKHIDTLKDEDRKLWALQDLWWSAKYKNTSTDNSTGLMVEDGYWVKHEFYPLGNKGTGHICITGGRFFGGTTC